MQADIIVTDDPAHPGQRSLWAASLSGAYVSTPDLLINASTRRRLCAPHVKYESPISMERHLFLSPKFVVKHVELTRLVRQATLLEGSLWVIHSSVANFNTLFLSAKKKRKHTQFKALTASREKQDLRHKTQVQFSLHFRFDLDAGPGRN